MSPSTATLVRRRVTAGVKAAVGRRELDVQAVRRQVLGLDQEMSGHRLVYLDAAATSQRLRAAAAAMDDLMRTANANVHQEGHELARQAKKRYDAARESITTFLNARSAEEVVWVHGTTEGINLLYTTWGLEHVKEGDNIVLTVQEHLSNILPWQLLARRTGCELHFVEVEASGRLRYDQLDGLVTRRTKLVGVSHVSNALGMINDLGPIVERAHRVGAKVLVDGAQSAPHLECDVREMGCDFFAFSGHKLLGPFGTGVLWGRSEILEEMTPFNAGGGSTERATLRTAQYTDPPRKFEGGTDNPSGAVGIAAAVDFVRDLGHRAIWDYEQRLVERGLEKLPEVKGLALLGVMKPEERVPIFTFTLEGKDPQKVARRLGDRGIAVSAGSLNADPLLKRFGLEGVVRASCYVYNTTREIDALADALHEIA